MPSRRKKLFARPKKARPVNTEEKRQLNPAFRSTSSQLSNAEEIARTLPGIFQRTHKNIVPLSPSGRAMSMDAALDCCGVNSLHDIYQVQGNIPAVVLRWFGSHSFIGHQACAILAQHWLIDKACTQAPKDAVQNGFKIVAAMPGGEVPPEVTQEIERLNRERDIFGECREFSRNSRIFGIRHALFLVDGLDYEAPFNPDGVRPGSYRGIAQIDPYWLRPEFDRSAIMDAGARHFYEPTWWRMPSGQRVHRSHFIISRESEVPDVLKPTYYYGGLPLPQRIYERVYAAERVADEAPELALSKRLTVMKGDVESYITDENATTNRLHAFNQIRSNFGFMMIGDGEELQQLDTSLAGFDELLMTNYQLVAAVASTPATKLLGTSPKGFNATGEHETESYEQELVSIQTSGMTPLLDRHHLLLCRSEFSEYRELGITTEWEPVRQPKPAEIAEINFKNAQTGQTLGMGGAFSPDELRSVTVKDPHSPFYGLPANDEPDFADFEDEPGLKPDQDDAGAGTGEEWLG